jgi:hypothetical protein
VLCNPPPDIVDPFDLDQKRVVMPAIARRDARKRGYVPEWGSLISGRSALPVSCRFGEPRDGTGGVNSLAQTAWTELALMRLTSEAHPQASS